MIKRDKINVAEGLQRYGWYLGNAEHYQEFPVATHEVDVEVYDFTAVESLYATLELPVLLEEYRDYLSAKLLANEKTKLDKGFILNGNTYSLAVERGYQLEKAISMLTALGVPEAFIYTYSDINYQPVNITFEDLKTLYQSGLQYVATIQGQRSTKMADIIAATTIEDLKIMDLAL